MPIQQLAHLNLPSGTWGVDPDGSRLAFAVKTMWGLADVKGTFERYEGELRVTDDGATGELRIDTSSLNTENKRRDDHLRSADFFDSSSHPHMTFTATGASDHGEGVLIAGELAVGEHRTTLEIPATVEAHGGSAATIRGNLVVPRSDVGLTWNKLGMMREDARLEIELHLTHMA